MIQASGRAHLPLLALLALVMTLGGCSWFGDDDEEELGPAPLLDFDPEGRVREAWDATVGSGMGERYNLLVPALVGSRLYVADAYGLVEARDLDTGERFWQTRIGAPEGGFLGSVMFWGRDDDGGSFVTGATGADEETVFIGTKNGMLIALRSSDGGELWRTQMSSEILAPATPGGDLVFVMTLDGRLTGLSRSDGSRVWSYDTQVPVLTLRGTSAPVYSDPLVFAGFANGRLTALGAENGQAVWEHVVALPTGRSELERMSDLDAAPLITPAGAFVASFQGSLKSLRLADGNVQWERSVSSFGALAEGYGQVYSTDDEGVIRAVDQASGNVVWEQSALLRRSVTGPAVFGAYLAVGDFEGYLHVFAQTDGRPVARMRIDRDGIRSAPIGIDDRVLVYSNGGRVGVYRLERDE